MASGLINKPFSPKIRFTILGCINFMGIISGMAKLIFARSPLTTTPNTDFYIIERLVTILIGGVLGLLLGFFSYEKLNEKLPVSYIDSQSNETNKSVQER